MSTVLVYAQIIQSQLYKSNILEVSYHTHKTSSFRASTAKNIPDIRAESKAI